MNNLEWFIIIDKFLVPNTFVDTKIDLFDMFFDSVQKNLELIEIRAFKHFQILNPFFIRVFFFVLSHQTIPMNVMQTILFIAFHHMCRGIITNLAFVFRFFLGDFFQ